MKISTATGIALIIILSTIYFVARDNGDSPSFVAKDEIKSEVSEGGQNSILKDGIQYVTIVARNGYAPKKSFAVAGVPTKLLVKTNSTFDCSVSLFIPTLNFRKMLPNTGETVIDAGIPKVGDKMQGVCSMGMYSFVVQFK